MLSGGFAAAGETPAFPGAEGFGARATGGRGQEVCAVTNLDDSGPGSLRDALSRGNRTVVFRVSGTINLKSRLDLRAENVTIAGQTAPGEGICLRGRELMIVDARNVIVRHLRFRPGDEQQAELDALSIRNSRDVIIDHCSMSWSTDSLNDVTHGSGNVTVQWCLLAEPLNASVHVKGAHGYGTGWGGHGQPDADGKIPGASYHHNLIAHCESRAPRIGYKKGRRGLIDCRNNVIYNTGGGSAYGGEGDDFNFVANYFRPGPSTKLRDVLFDVWSDDSRLYVAGNVVEGSIAAGDDNRRGLRFKGGSVETCVVASPFDVPAVTTDPAGPAFRRVLEDAGATRPARDAVDRRIIADVQNRTGRIINSQTETGGWPELKSAAPPTDSDEDGMPDAWERARGLNPTDPADGRTVTETGYTQLELYLNDLAAGR
jgi:pectate lyase